MLSTWRPELQVDALVQDHADLLVQYRLRQPERGDVAAHEPAGRVQALEDGHVVAERRKVVGDGERRRARADARDALAVLLRGRLRQLPVQVALQIGRSALQPADRDGFFLHAPAAARRLARPIADAPENAREHIGLPVEKIGVRVTALGDQADVFRHVGMRRARPLAVHDAVKIVRMRGVGGVHATLFMLLRTLQRGPNGLGAQ